MSLTIETATLRIGTKMQRTEELADETAQSAAELFAEIVQAGNAFRDHEAARFAQPALARAHKAIGDLVAARAGLAHVHNELLGALKITMTPAEDDCPEWVTRAVDHDGSIAA